VDPTVVAFPQGTAAPEHFSAAEAELWRAVMASRKPGYFGAEVHPVLESYCTTAVMCDHIAARLRVEEGIAHGLLETFDRMSRLLVDLATALCLLPARQADS